MIESGIKTIKVMLRVHLMALERKLGGVNIPTSHPIITLLTEYAADVLTKDLVGADGNSGYQRLWGENSNEEEFEFGERVRAGKKYWGLDKSPIPNLGEIRGGHFETEDNVKACLLWQVANIERPLVAGAQITTAGNKVELDADWGGKSICKKSGRTIKLQKRGKQRWRRLRHQDAGS